MKIKVIDLLIKNANGEYPKKFKYNGKIYEYKKIVQGTGYVTENYNWFNSDIHIDDWYNLNNEVEIIEEDKTIKELKTEIENTERKLIGTSGTKYSIRVVDNILINKINELVKEINKLKKTINKITGTDKVIEEIKKEIDKLKENK